MPNRLEAVKRDAPICSHFGGYGAGNGWLVWYAALFVGKVPEVPMASIKIRGA
jgi:hypothetical protein